MASLSSEVVGWGDARTASQRIFAFGENVFSRRSTASWEDDDEEALKWAALEKLPTFDRLRKGFLQSLNNEGKVIHEEVDVTKLGYGEKQQLVEKILRVIEDDNERFLRKLRARIDK